MRRSYVMRSNSRERPGSIIYLAVPRRNVSKGSSSVTALSAWIRPRSPLKNGMPTIRSGARTCVVCESIWSIESQLRTCADSDVRRSALGMTRRLPPRGPNSTEVESGAAYKPGFVPSPRCRVRVKIIPLGRPLLVGSSTLTRTPRQDLRLGDRADSPKRCPYSSLLREGLASPPVTRLSRVGSYPTISTLPVPILGASPRAGHRRCNFCCAFPRVSSGRC